MARIRPFSREIRAYLLRVIRNGGARGLSTPIKRPVLHTSGAGRKDDLLAAGWAAGEAERDDLAAAKALERCFTRSLYLRWQLLSALSAVDAKQAHDKRPFRFA